MMDRLAGFFKQYNFSAQMFYAGTLCKNKSFDEDARSGHLHLIRSGEMTVLSPFHLPLQIHEPCLLFYPRPVRHHFVLGSDANVDLVCAALNIGADSGSPLADALPAVQLIRLQDLPGLEATLELLFKETMHERCGRVAAINRLFEYLLIQLLRHILDQKQITTGLLAGLADKRLSKAITAMHNDAGHPWSLDALAHEAGMSRARFAVHFRNVVGMTAGDYLSKWRISQAQSFLRKGKPLAWIAGEVGYSSAPAFSKAFKAQLGCAPGEWLKLAGDGKAAG